MARTALDQAQAKPITLHLGGRDFTVAPLKGGPALEFQAVALGCIGDLDPILSKIDFNSGGVTVGGFASLVQFLVAKHSGDLWALLVLYCQWDEEDATWVYANAEFDELLAAFKEVGQLAFPLLRWARRLMGAQKVEALLATAKISENGSTPKNAKEKSSVSSKP